MMMTPLVTMWSPTWIFWLVMFFVSLEFAWELLLDLRQRRVVADTLEPPSDLKNVMEKSTFTKARLYSLDKSKLNLVRSLFDQLLSTCLMYCYSLKHFYSLAAVLSMQGEEENELVVSMVFVFVLNVFNVVLSLPFTLYSVFVVEEKHGFNEQTLGFFVKDQLKKFVIGQALMIPLIAAIIQIVKWGGDYFFLYLWLFVVLFTLLMLIIYPEFIAPLMDKYVPLHQGELRDAIEALASQLDFPLYKLYVVQGSKRSAHSNAYFYGFFKFKRIVLFDTLMEKSERSKVDFGDHEATKERIEGKTESKESEQQEVKSESLENEEHKEKKEIMENGGKIEVDGDETKDSDDKGCSHAEILAVLAHELGHWQYNHVLKNLIISQVHIFLMFALFASLYKQKALYEAFGFVDSQPTLIGLMIILQYLTVPYNALLNFMMICLSRYFEFQADAFAVALGKAKYLKTALIKLNNDNLGFPCYDAWYSSWHLSHPPLLERLQALDNQHKKKDE